MSKPKVHRDWSISLDGQVVGWVGHTRGSYRGNVFWTYDRRGLYGRRISGNGVFHTRAEAVAALVASLPNR